MSSSQTKLVQNNSGFKLFGRQGVRVPMASDHFGYMRLMERLRKELPTQQKRQTVETFAQADARSNQGAAKTLIDAKASIITPSYLSGKQKGWHKIQTKVSCIYVSNQTPRHNKQIWIKIIYAQYLWSDLWQPSDAQPLCTFWSVSEETVGGLMWRRQKVNL